MAAKPRALDRAAALFRALGDPARLRLLVLLEQGERCVSELVDVLGEKFPTVSQRLRLLRNEGLVVRRRDGNHLHYALADRHVADLVKTALDHSPWDLPANAPFPASTIGGHRQNRLSRRWHPSQFDIFWHCGESIVWNGACRRAPRVW